MKWGKLDGVALLITDPPATFYTTLSEQEAMFLRRNFKPGATHQEYKNFNGNQRWSVKSAERNSEEL